MTNPQVIISQHEHLTIVTEAHARAATHASLFPFTTVLFYISISLLFTLHFFYILISVIYFWLVLLFF